jgi:hypothetical protein
MKKFKIEDKTWELPTNFEEMTLAAFLRISDVQEKNSETIFKELYIIKLLEALVGAQPGDLDDITLEELGDLTIELDYLNTNPRPSQVTEIKIEDKIYIFPQNFNKISAGEYISIKTLTDGKSVAETILNLLAVILRPGIKYIDAETGAEKWKQIKFDAENLDYRKKLFLNLPVLDVLWSVNFFLTNGNLELENFTKDSIQEELQQKV